MGKSMEIVLDPNGACELPNFVCNIQPIESPYSFVHPHDLSQYSTVFKHATSEEIEVGHRL